MDSIGHRYALRMLCGTGIIAVVLAEVAFVNDGGTFAPGPQLLAATIVASLVVLALAVPQSPRRRFRRPPPEAPTIIWQPGDMAECIRDDWWAAPPKHPRIGDVAMVERVIRGPHGAGLTLFRYACAWNAGAFRKLPPAGRREPSRILTPVVVE